MLLLIIIGLYIVGGLSWITYCIIQNESFDLSDIGCSNLLVYSLGILFWWYWVYLKIAKK